MKLSNKTITASTNSSRTKIVPDNPCHGSFNGHTVSIEVSPTTTSRCEVREDMPEVLEKHGFELENTPDDYDEGIQKFAFICSDPKTLIQGYVRSYKRNAFEFKGNEYYCASIGSMVNGLPIDLCHSSYERLLKTGLLFTGLGAEERIALPTLSSGGFNMWDCFGWFRRDVEVVMKFEQISKAFEMMASLSEGFYKQVEKITYNPKVSFLSKKSSIYHSGIVSKGIVRVSEPSHLDLSKKDRVAGSVVKIANAANTGSINSQERMKLKLEAIKGANELDKKRKESALVRLRHLKEFWPIISKMYPSRIQAYMIFETVLYHSFDALNGLMTYPNFDLYREIVMDYLERLSFVLLNTLEILLPYAVEITEALNIDLKNDPLVKGILNNGKCLIPRSQVEELEECLMIRAEIDARPAELEECLKIRDEIRARQTSERKNVKQDEKVLEERILPERKEDESISLSLEERRIEELARKEQAEINKSVARKKANELRKVQEEAKKTRRLNEKAKQVRLRDRKVIQAEEMSEQYKKELLIVDGVKRKNRLQSQGKIHDLPSDDLAQKFIDELSGESEMTFQKLFGEIDNNNTMSHKEVVNLAGHFWVRLDAEEIGCADDFFAYVISRIHHRHDSDTGADYPTHYVDIMRSCFVVFNLKRKDWVPQTSEDFDAEFKLDRRKADAMYWKNNV